MGADIYLQSVWSRKPPLPVPVESGNTLLVSTSPQSGRAMLNQLQAFFDEARASGGYFRNGYNAGDVMWAMGLSWHGTVKPMLKRGRLPIRRARELIAMIEARPLIRERVAAHLFEHMTDGVEPHPTTGALHQMIQKVAAEEAGEELPPKLSPPDLDHLFGFLNARREELLTILRKSIELDEWLFCEL